LAIVFSTLVLADGSPAKDAATLTPRRAVMMSNGLFCFMAAFLFVLWLCF